MLEVKTSCPSSLRPETPTCNVHFQLVHVEFLSAQCCLTARQQLAIQDRWWRHQFSPEPFDRGRKKSRTNTDTLAPLWAVAAPESKAQFLDGDFCDQAGPVNNSHQIPKDNAAALCGAFLECKAGDEVQLVD